MAFVVHPHFHPRRTGVTAHTELIAEALGATDEVSVIGDLMPAALRRTSFLETWRRARAGPVVWHAHRNNELLWGLLLRALAKRLSVVYTTHSPRPVGWFTRLLAKRADRVVSLNRDAEAWIRTPSTIVQHGVDLRRFHPPTDRAAAFAALGLPGRRGVGVVGRIRPNKGQGDFVEALAPLLEAHADWTPLLVGRAKGGDEAWADGLAAKTGGRLKLVGEHRDVSPWYRGLSILVHPSYAEAFSMVLIEAMASGCCVVATRIAAVPEVVEHGRTGFLFDPGDVAGLRDLLGMLMADPALVARVGAAAAEEARARFGIDREAAALSGIYRELAGA
jgi:mannosyltransferase